MKRLLYVLIFACMFALPAAAGISAPGNIKATLSNDNKWELNWAAPAEPCDKYYEIFGQTSLTVTAGDLLGTTFSFYYKDEASLPGTEYYYKIRAVGVTLTVDSQGALSPVIKTLPMPPLSAAITMIPQNSKVLLSWLTATAEPMTSYNIYRSVTTTASGYTQLAAVLQNSGQYLDTGVINGIAYFYKIAGFYNGEGPLSTPEKITPFAAPFAPGNLSGTVSVSGNDIVLNWSVANIRGTYDVSRFNIYKDMTSLTPAATPAASVTSYTHTPAVKSEYYQYRITTEDVHGNTSMPAIVSVYMPDGSINTPSALAVTDVTSSRVAFTWASLNDTDQITGFKVYRDSTAIAVTKAASYTDTSVLTGSTYEYYVTAFKGTDPEVTGCNAITVTVLPAAPVNLTVSQTAAGVLQLWWDNPANEDATIYNIYRSADGITYDSPVAITWGARTYEDLAGLALGDIYHYKLTALKESSASAWSDTISARTVTVPVPPLDITDIGGTPYNGYVYLSWTAESDYDIRTFTVFYRADSTQNTLTAVSNTPDKYIAGLTNGTGYTFRVTGTNALGSGNAAAAISYRMTPTSSPALDKPDNLVVDSPGDSTIRLTWNPVNGAASYDIYRTLDPIISADVFVVNVPANTYTDVRAFTENALFWYRVRAVDAQALPGADYSAINSSNAFTRPGVPENVELNNTAGGILLSWTPPSAPYTYSPPGYKIYRSTSASGDFGTAIGETNKTYYEDLCANTLQAVLYYKVKSTDSMDNSDTGTAVYTIDINQPIGPPPTLVARPGNKRVTLNWKKVTPEYYNIYRSEDEYAFTTPVAYNINFDGREYIDTDTNIMNKTQYFYTIAAVTRGGEGPKSMTASAIPYAPPVIVKTPPVTCRKTTGKNVEITWPKADSAGSEGYDITGYNIYRSRDNGWTYTLVTRTPYLAEDYSYVELFTDTSTQWDSKYTYLIKVVDWKENIDTVYDPAYIELPMPRNKLKLHANLMDLSRSQSLKWQYVLVKPGKIKVNVYTLSGVFVKNLLDTEYTLPASTLEPFESPEYLWDGTNAKGNKVASGVYLFILELNGEKTIAKIAVIK
jgi:fibronectin type 3 domain-containing protein